MNSKLIKVFPSWKWGIKRALHSLEALLILILLILIHQTIVDDDGDWRLTSGGRRGNNGSDETEVKEHGKLKSCDLFSGKWVYDNVSYPIYKEQDCSFVNDQLACQKFGRGDLDYQHWRWQPHRCDLPRFNGEKMLEKLRGKRMVFVGDSLNRNQWSSMVCLVQSFIPPTLQSVHVNGNFITFNAIEYNATIAFYWSPLLVESNSDDPINHRIADRIVRIDSIEKHAANWADSDILVFNSYLWWKRATLKVSWETFEKSNGTYEEIEMLRCFEMAIKTWSTWLQSHIHRTKTRLFFVSLSPTHNRAEEWGKPPTQKCTNETDPIFRDGYWGLDSDPRMMRIVEDAIIDLQSKGLNIEILNITQLSEYRKDGHPSLYGKKWGPPEELANPIRFADCTHWCLPGVPDVWNQLLYAYLFL
ncbi:protein trichome birefringence-like 34 [Impatiens glandulifera]|uniref:protein trichome birefringence-like 34 n=1 Tax=Impatiens glandulifera TaxID=253017 RepID=UPI001FB0A2B3|nr:protein trichome birefringence-like 34 [Impatiens glandulifera]